MRVGTVINVIRTIGCIGALLTALILAMLAHNQGALIVFAIAAALIWK